MRDWQKLPTATEKITAVRDFFREHVGYARGWVSRSRIAAAPGRNNLERIASAKEGNCYDTNRLAYVILQKLGISTELYTGLSIGDRKKIDKAKFLLPILSMQKNKNLGMEVDASPGNFLWNGNFLWKDTEGTRESKSSHAHAFLRYFDENKQAWLLFDVTPAKTLADKESSKKYEKDREVEKAWWLKEMDVINQEVGWDSTERVAERLQHVQTQIGQFRDVWFPGNRGSSGEDTYLVKDEETGYVVEREQEDIDVDINRFGMIIDNRYSGFSKREMRKEYLKERTSFEAVAPFVERSFPEFQRVLNETLQPLQDAVNAYVDRHAMRRTTLGAWKQELIPYLTDEENDMVLNPTVLKRGLLRYLVQSFVPFPLSGEIYYSKKYQDLGYKRTAYVDKQVMRDTMQAELEQTLLQAREKIHGITEVLRSAGKVDSLKELQDDCIENVLHAKRSPQEQAEEKAGELLSGWIGGWRDATVEDHAGMKSYGVTDDAGKKFRLRVQDSEEKKSRRK